MASQIGQRLVFQNAKAAIKRAGLSSASAVLSQSYLRFEAPLSTGTTNYKFDVLVNESVNPSYTTQFKLNLQDAFVASEIGIFVAKPSSATDTTFQLCTYPNSVIFSGAGTAAALYTLYQGNLQLLVNQRQILTGWDAYRHYSVPQTQDSATTIDQQDGSASGFFPVEPNIVFVGSKKNDLTLNLPAALAAVEANSRVVVIMRGILAQSVTPVN